MYCFAASLILSLPSALHLLYCAYNDQNSLTKPATFITIMIFMTQHQEFITQCVPLVSMLDTCVIPAQSDEPRGRNSATEKIQSFPLKRVLPLIISAMMHPTDQMSTRIKKQRQNNISHKDRQKERNIKGSLKLRYHFEELRGWRGYSRAVLLLREDIKNLWCRLKFWSQLARNTILLWV